ncbi:MAG TPA: heme-binding domain-containing protein [Vicinamibacteria bacterium]|nr:heme-binding domain-containing protein [Vicinamibacteria bacterium]
MSGKVLVLLFLGAVAVLAQVYPPIARVNPPASVEIAAPPEVRRIFRGSCYDCHSNETRWPWYSYVAPGSWMVAGDVHDARSRMNFSRWPHAVSSEVDCYFKRRIIERIGKGEMPPLRYRLLHPSATVTDEDEALLRNWTTEQCGEGS